MISAFGVMVAFTVVDLLGLGLAFWAVVVVAGLVWLVRRWREKRQRRATEQIWALAMAVYDETGSASEAAHAVGYTVEEVERLVRRRENHRSWARGDNDGRGEWWARR